MGSKSQMPSWCNCGQSTQRPTASSFHHDMSSCFMIYGRLLELLTYEELKCGPAVASRRQRGCRAGGRGREPDTPHQLKLCCALFLFLVGVASRDRSIAGTVQCFEGISDISSKYGAAALVKKKKKQRKKILQKSSLWSSQEYSFALVATRTHTDCVSPR